MTKAIRFALLLAGLVPGAVAAQDPPRLIPEPMLNPGDMVTLQVWMNAEMSGDFKVAPDSTLGHPLLREVKVAGVPISVAEERLRVFLGRFASNPYLVLLPRYRVLVAGAVGSPGFYTVSPNVTLTQAVLLAGGPNDRGRLDRVHLVRDGEDQVFDLTNLDALAGRQPVRSGDTIRLDRRGSVFRDYLIPVATVVGSLSSVLLFFRRF